MKIGFIAGCKDLTSPQRDAIRKIARRLNYEGHDFLLHGDTVGATESAHAIFVRESKAVIEIYPSTSKRTRSYCNAATPPNRLILHKPAESRTRFRRLIRNCQSVIVCVSDPAILRSYAYQYATKHVKIALVFANGIVRYV